ncbi:MAG: hypothetical protein KBC33_03650 [Candidatus Pacebacteria bacterium]|nr:hypothetical protein [Candidatus Paceibacterota bacterium]
MKNIVYIVCAGVIVGLLTFTGFVQVAQAETSIGHIVELEGDVEWSVQGSPYILADDVFVGQGVTLTIQPGVEVKGFSSEQRGGIVVSGGTLIVEGTRDERISIHGLNGIGASDGGMISMKFADLSDMFEALNIDSARAMIATSTISGSEIGIKTRSSSVTVVDTEIATNGEGIHISSPGIFQARVGGSEATKGTSSAFDDSGFDEGVVVIRNSIIEDNTDSGAVSADIVQAQMEGNWWGSPDGPGSEEGDSVTGNVAFEPWLTQRPVYGAVASTCCSSVLFIPGLQASRLYRTEADARGIKRINQLWEPNRNDDVKKLFLNQNGSSIDPGIYAGGPIDSALGVADIYGSFMVYLDTLQDEGTIGEWKSYGYDWRKSIAEVVAGSERRATSSESLVKMLEGLAMRSRTGKVSVIAHSNGGLVAKYLVKKLMEVGKESLVDTVISVGVPYLGTPQAILGLLHGEGQSIGGGMILKQSVARELGINMASAYSLLPSKEYFKNMLGPTIVFASTTVQGINTGSYSQQIDTYDGQKGFILDSKNSRRTTVASKVTLPIEGNKILFAAADAIHSVIDPFSWPSTIAHWALVGWGNKTAKGVAYSDKTECRGPGKRPLCITSTHYEPITTSLGDGTVVTPSAGYDAGTVVSINLPAQEEIDSTTIKHANILESSTVQDAVGDIIVSQEESVKDKLKKLPGVTIGLPDASDEEEFLVLSTHSPVNLHLYDAQGNHTGLIAPPTNIKLQEGDEGLDEDLYSFYEEKIPGSSFEMREGDIGNETYITLDGDRVGSYDIKIQGTGSGTFDYIVERIKGDEIIDRVEYLDMPVNQLTVATGTIAIFGAESDDQVLASSTMLRVDTDRNGRPDLFPRPKWGKDISCRHKRWFSCSVWKRR